MTLAIAVDRVRRLSRTSISGLSNQLIMERINEGLKEYGKASADVTKEGFVTITPRFDIQTNRAIRLTITGSTNNDISATDIAICATSALDQTGTQVATALQTTIRAAIGGSPDLTVAWSTTEWTFTIDAIDSTSIVITNPTTITYASALKLLGLGDETTTGTSVTSSLPTDCTLESALPTDFLHMATAPEWDGNPLSNAQLDMFKSPAASGVPGYYHIRNKNIMLYPVPTQQKVLKIWYKALPDTFTTVAGYQECGLSGIAEDTATGLSATTQYYFKVTIDGGSQVEYDITTASSLVYEDVIDLMNDEINGAKFAIVSGDLRCTSDLIGSASAIALAAGTTGTDLFATLTGFSSFDTAVATEAGDSLDVDDEFAEAVCYFAAHKIAEENYETALSDRYFAQAKRIVNDLQVHRANNNPGVFPEREPVETEPEVEYAD